MANRDKERREAEKRFRDSYDKFAKKHPVLAGIIGIIFIAGVVYLNFFHKKEQTPTKPTTEISVAPMKKTAESSQSEKAVTEKVAVNNEVVPEEGTEEVTEAVVVEEVAPAAVEEYIEGAQTYTIKNKTFFHTQPSESTIKKAYLLEGDVITIDEIRDDFGYATFTNAKGKKTKGWIKMSDCLEYND